MSAIMTLRGLTMPEKIFVWCDFNLVWDAILFMVPAKNAGSYEKVFVFKNAAGWETDILRSHFNDDAYTSICSKLNNILALCEHSKSLKNTDDVEYSATTLVDFE